MLFGYKKKDIFDETEISEGRSEAIVKDLIANTEIVTETTENAGVKISAVGYEADSDGTTIYSFCDITATRALEPGYEITVKYNLYDASGNILGSESDNFIGEDFTGYETFRFMFYDEGIVRKAKKAKVFVTKKRV